MSIGESHDGLERLIGTGPVLAQELGPSGAKRVPKRQRGDEDIVQLTGNRDEVRYEVDRNRQIGDQREQNQLAPSRDTLIPNQTAQQHEAIRDEARERPRLCPPTDDNQDRDQREIRKEADAGSDEQPSER